MSLVEVLLALTEAAETAGSLAMGNLFPQVGATGV